METFLLNRKIVTYLVHIILLLLLVYSTFLAIKYSGQLLLDDYAFRQTQTALTSFWFMKTGFKFAYETPVLGFPWSVPFEFPLFQYIVAKISSIFNVDLQQTGRLISYLFLITCLIPVVGIFKKIFLSSWLMPCHVFLVLFLSSPIYLYWGRTFMIETEALFFSLCFLYYSILLIQGDLRWKNIFLGSVFLLIGLLQKGTTALPLLLIMGMLSARHVFVVKSYKINFIVFFKFTIIFIFPLVMACLWTEFTDVVKTKNYVGAQLTSKMMSGWYYGNLDMRISKALWYNTIWLRVISANISGYLGCLLILLGMIFLNNRERKLIFTSLILFFIYFMIFTNLHIVHSYYQVANTIFLIAALAFAVSEFILKFPSSTYFMFCILMILVCLNIYHFQKGYYLSEKIKFDNTHQTIAISDFIRANTSPDDPILVYGYDWSSEVSFFSQRKTLTFPVWAHISKDNFGPIENPTYYLGQQPSAIVICQILAGGDNTKELISKVNRYFKPKSVTKIQDCNIYLK